MKPTQNNTILLLTKEQVARVLRLATGHLSQQAVADAIGTQQGVISALFSGTAKGVSRIKIERIAPYLEDQHLMRFHWVGDKVQTYYRTTTSKELADILGFGIRVDGSGERKGAIGEPETVDARR